MKNVYPGAKPKELGGKNKISEKDNTGKVVKVKSRLTDNIIHKLQNYFGIALRSNIGDLKKCKKLF